MYYMKEAIEQKLKEIEQQKGVKILLAIESGSRAWGFHSPDSDYDVRFVYVHSKQWYVGIEDRKDFMNVEVNEVFDVVGYDVRKTLKFFYATNSKIFEWIQSPIFYKKDESFVNALLQMIPEYYSSRKGIHHYLGLTRNTLNNDLQSDTVKLKKYFYALRPVLAAYWIAKNGSCPPMVFGELKTLITDPIIKEKVENLLQIKKSSDEKFTIQKDNILNQFILETMNFCETYVKNIEYKEANTSALNALFAKTIGL